MKRYFIDTNIFLRAILEDHPVQSVQAQKLLSSITSSENSYYTTLWVIAEIVWTLNSFYKFPRNQTLEVIEGIINSRVKVLQEQLLLESLSYYKDINVDFVDCINYAMSKRKKTDSVISFDKDFTKLGADQIEPLLTKNL